ncbi:acetyl-CoA acetyltransferase [Bryobacterales bacterium F-183]|nr:acetyl-CoA acetyltransferase [Bryobacterales bacterium F-183]
MPRDAYICDAVRTPFGRYGGALAQVRTDDLAAHPLKVLRERHPQVDWEAVDDVLYGCANQAGEDNRNIARMATLLAGLPVSVPAATINRLCGSSLDAIATAARTIQNGDANLILAGGVESMSRAPFVMAKSDAPFARNIKIEDTTLGWRFINPAMQTLYGTHSMGETAENVAAEWNISRQDQDAFALRSQQRYNAANLAQEIEPIAGLQKDEHPRPNTTLEALAKLKPVIHPNTGTVTAGNASGINDGAAAVILASGPTAARYNLQPIARVVTSAVAAVPPRVMGIGPVPATQKALAKAGLTIAQMDVIELNEAFAAQALAVLRDLGIPDDAPHVNPNGGAIAVGHPLGASGARLAATAAFQLRRTGGRYALVTMCVGVGQGISLILERV